MYETEIRKGLYGSDDEKKDFKTKRLATAKAEIRDDPNWKFWDDIDDWDESVAVLKPLGDSHVFENIKADKLLGYKMYNKAGELRNSAKVGPVSPTFDSSSGLPDFSVWLPFRSTAFLQFFWVSI